MSYERLQINSVQEKRRRKQDLICRLFSLSFYWTEVQTLFPVIAIYFA